MAEGEAEKSLITTTLTPVLTVADHDSSSMFGSDSSVSMKFETKFLCTDDNLSFIINACRLLLMSLLNENTQHLVGALHAIIWLTLTVTPGTALLYIQGLYWDRCDTVHPNQMGSMTVRKLSNSQCNMTRNL